MVTVPELYILERYFVVSYFTVKRRCISYVIPRVVERIRRDDDWEGDLLDIAFNINIQNEYYFIFH